MTPAAHIRMMSCRETLSLLPVSVIFHSHPWPERTRIAAVEQQMERFKLPGLIQEAYPLQCRVGGRGQLLTSSSGREPADDSSQRQNNFTSVLGPSAFIIQQLQACSIGTTLFSALTGRFTGFPLPHIFLLKSMADLTNATSQTGKTCESCDLKWISHELLVSKER